MKITASPLFLLTVFWIGVLPQVVQGRQYELLPPDVEEKNTQNFETEEKEFDPLRRNPNWEFGISGGVAYPLGTSDFSLSINNDVLTLPELQEEYTENGLPPPGAGFSTIKGKEKSSYEVGGYLLRRVTPDLFVGLDFGYAIEQTVELEDRGIYITPLFNIEFHNHLAHVTPEMRWGRWVGHFRPQVSVGLGWYSLNQNVSITITDPFDLSSEPPPVTVYSKSDDYLGANFGVGLDVLLLTRTTLGFDLRYHKVFNPGGNLNAFSPALRFAYRF